MNRTQGCPKSSTSLVLLPLQNQGKSEFRVFSVYTDACSWTTVHTPSLTESTWGRGIALPSDNLPLATGSHEARPLCLNSKSLLGCDQLRPLHHSCARPVLTSTHQNPSREHMHVEILGILTCDNDSESSMTE